jgi:hypothetical protein
LGKKALVFILLSSVIDILMYCHPKLKINEKYQIRVINRIGPYKIQVKLETLRRLSNLLPWRFCAALQMCLAKLFKFFSDVSIIGDMETSNLEGSTVVFGQYLELRSPMPLIANVLKKKYHTTNIVFIPSWDNLTTKACLKGEVDKVWCWAEFQKKEAYFHRCSSTVFEVVGNFAWSHPKNLKPHSHGDKSQSQATKKVLYLCSSPQIAPNEERDILDLLLSRSTESIEEFQINIWKHPQQNLSEHKICQLKNVAIQRADETMVTSRQKHENYLKALQQYDLIVGQATSAVVECAILGLNTVYFDRRQFSAPFNSYHSNYLKSMLPVIYSFEEIRSVKTAKQKQLATFFGVTEN